LHGINQQQLVVFIVTGYFNFSHPVQLLHCETKKMTFYFCNNFVEPHWVMIIFETEILK